MLQEHCLQRLTPKLPHTFAAYVFAKGMTDENPVLLGSYIMEGSKAGATVAAVWVANGVVPLNISGYGRITVGSHEAAGRFYKILFFILAPL